jgi:hypothetical protein
LFIWKKINGVTEKGTNLEHYVDLWLLNGIYQMNLSLGIVSMKLKASYNGLSFNNIDGKYKRDIFLMYYHYIQ